MQKGLFFSVGQEPVFAVEVEIVKGRKPKPVATHIAEGDPSHLGKARLDRMLATLPKAARGLGDPPSHLTGLARQQWAIWKKNLEAMDQDFRADRVFLEGACVHYARAIEADEILKDGCEIEEAIDVSGEKVGTRMKKHPAVAVSNSSWRMVKAFCSDLGLSLVTRQQLAIQTHDTGGDDLMELLSKPRPPK